MNFYLALPTDVIPDLNYLVFQCRLRFWANEERRGVQSRDSILVVSRGSSFLLVQYLHILTTATRLLVHELVWCRKFVLAVGLVILLDHFYSCFVVILYRDMGCNM
ncbi:hypothetical protein SORBI_3007G083800 [Sorghum bicolor]|uniref:Uncharacterized protein n=1 Tax=Sorghum bicolor TaxID=4558 RepID=A0A1B6PGG8_SORBI|nr:hypothetical protein SORBI_3007G083800 [Sorghum bicolor]